MAYNVMACIFIYGLGSSGLGVDERSKTLTHIVVAYMIIACIFTAYQAIAYAVTALHGYGPI